MSVGSKPGDFTTDPGERELFDWLEHDLRDKTVLISLQRSIQLSNPTLYRTIADAASELAPGDPRSHATYFGSFLLLSAEMNLVEPLPT